MNNSVSSSLELAPAVPLRARRWRFDPALLLFTVLVLVLCALVVNPIVRLIWESLRASDGSLTFTH